MANGTIYDLRDQLTVGQISRRQFLKRAGALGISAAATSTLLASATAAAASRKSGGTLRVCIASGGQTDSLDPTKFLSTGDYARGHSIYNPLVALNPSMEPIPALAESWESNSTADEWVFKLRKGVTFSNGKDFTSADVLYSLQRHLRPESESPGKPLLEQVTEMTADGAHVVRMKTGSPNADLPILFTQPQFMISQEGEEEFVNPSGTGGFIMKEYEVGIYARVERNPNYWGDCYLDALEWITNVDGTARMNAMMAGEYDIATEVDRNLIDLVQRAPGVEIVASASGRHTNLAMMADRDPTSNHDLRQALKYSIPREQVITNAFKGYGMVGNDHQVSPTDPFYCDDIPQRTFDPDKARHHFKKAGMEGANLTLYTSDMAVSGSEAIALIYAEGAKVAGIDLQVQVAPPGSYWSKVWMQVPLCVSGWDARPTADLMLTIANKSDGSWNETAWGSERFDELLVAARGETDAAKRKGMYCEMQRLLHDDGGVGMLGFYDMIDSRRDNVVGFDPHPAGYNRDAFFATDISFA
jgi:peptide/nickel transport system substrate-binding protein